MLATKSFHDAIATLEKARTINPRNAEAAYSLGLLRAEEGNAAAARACFEAALATDPGDVQAMSRCAELCAAEGDFASEEGWHRKVLKREPTTIAGKEERLIRERERIL